MRREWYRGALTRVAGAHTVAHAPLSDSDTAGLVSELLGPDSSNDALGRRIAKRAAGNPFFAEEIVRELAGRGVLRGEPGAYLSAAEVGDVSVPVTLQATTAAVLGAPFSLHLLAALGVEAVVDDLLAAQLIDQVRFTRRPQYAFHHPSIRTVAYERQREPDRAELHRRVAFAIARMTLGIALVHRPTSTERDRGQQILAEVGEVFRRRGFFLTDLPIVEVCLAREKAQRGDRDAAIPHLRAAADGQFREGRLLGWSIPTTGALVETLLDRGPRVTWSKPKPKPKPKPRSSGWRRSRSIG